MAGPETRGAPDHLPVVAVLALAALLRLGAVIAIPAPLVSDYLGYWQIANDFAAGIGLLHPAPSATAMPSVGYPLMLAAAFRLAGASIATVKGANLLLGVLGVWLTILAATRLAGSRPAGLLAGLMLAGYVEAIAYTAYPAKENLMIPLVMAQLALVADSRRQARPDAAALGFGVLGGLLGMVGNAAFSFVPGLLALAWAPLGGRRAMLRFGAIALLAGAVTTAPLMTRNLMLFGAYALNNNGGVNLFVGNNPTNATPYYQDPHETEYGQSWNTVRDEMGEQRFDAMLRQKAMRYILDNPGRTAVLALRKALAFWEPPTHEGHTADGAAERLMRLAWLGEYLLLCLLCLPTLAGLLRRERAAIGLWLMLAGYTGIHMVFYVIYRYRLPVMPIVAIGAAMTLARLLAAWRPAR